MAFERAHVARKQSEANGAAAVAVVDAVDQRRQFLALVVVGREQVRLMPAGGNQVEQHDADAERLGARNPQPEQTPTDSAVAIAASYAAKAFGIKTGTLVREARRLCPAVIPVQANHRLYTEYHERILKAVDTCLPVEKVCSIDEMACRLMGTERQVPVARELALKARR
jgi:hypothetical protein